MNITSWDLIAKRPAPPAERGKRNGVSAGRRSTCHSEGAERLKNLITLVDSSLMLRMTLKRLLPLFLAMVISLPPFTFQTLPSFASTANIQNENIKNKKVPYKEIRQRKHSKNKSNPKAQVVTSDLVLNLDARNIDGINTPARDATTATTWTNLSGSTNGTLTSFTLPSSATSGWRGSNARYDPSNLTFDGTDDYVTLGMPSNLDIQTSATIAVWIKLNALGGNKYFVSNFDGTGSKSQGSLRTVSSKFSIYSTLTTNATVAVSGTTSITTGQWYHVAFTRDDSNKVVKLYVNGIEEGSTTYTGMSIVAYANTGNWIIGNSLPPYSDFINGSIANVRIYNRALTSDEVLGNYLAEAPNFSGPSVVTSNLVLDLDASKYDNASPATSATSSMTWTDRSGNSYNGTLTNFTLPTAGSASGWDTGTAGGSLTPSVLKFDGTDDNVVIDNAALNNFCDYNAGTGTTISAWAKTSSATNQTIVGLGSNASSTPLCNLTFLASGVARYQYRADNGQELGGGAWDSTRTVNDNAWHNIVLRRSGNTFEIYIDGAVNKTGTSSATFNTITTQRQSIGVFRGWTTSQYFTGQVANVRLYNTALSASQISQNYLAELPKFNNLSGTPRISLATRSSGTAVGTDDPFYTADYGETLTLNFTSTDLESDTVTLSTPTAPTVGTFTAGPAAHPGTAVYSYSPSSNDINMIYKFTVRATASSGQTSNDLVVTIKGTNYYLPSPAPAALPVSQDVTAPSSSNSIQTPSATPTATPVQNITNTNNGSTNNSQGTTVSAPSINTAPTTNVTRPNLGVIDASIGGIVKPKVTGIDISTYKPQIPLNVKPDSAKPYIDVSKGEVKSRK